MGYALVIIGSAVCAVQAIRARHLIVSALWLAGTSALVSIALYALGARTAAVIELSVGAGLVTVLFVFAISIAGDDALQARAFISNRLAIILVLGFVGLLAWMVLPLETTDAILDEVPFADVMWDDRALDALVQLVLIFTGVLCLLGLLADKATPSQTTEEHQTSLPLTLTMPGNGQAILDRAERTIPETEKPAEKEEVVS